MFAAAANRSRYYLMERDPVGIGGPTNFNPFTNADNSLKAMRGNPAPTLFAAPQLFASVPAGTAAAANQMPITVTNIGDAPLVFGTTAPTIQAEANDGGAATAADFSVVSQNCTGQTLAAAATRRSRTTRRRPPTRRSPPSRPARAPSTSASSRRAPTTRRSLACSSAPRPTTRWSARCWRARAPLTRSRRWAATSPASCRCGIGTAGSFGSFTPAVARTYDAATAATVTSTAGNATLSVTDTSTTAPGHLVNQTFSLPSALTVRAANAAQTNPAYVPLSETAGTPVNLLTYTGPTTTDPVTLGFRQAIGATDVLRAGTYSKTLTFTLSTTQP